MAKFDDKNHWDWSGENYKDESIIQCDTFETLSEYIYNDNCSEELIKNGWNKIVHYVDGNIITYAEITLDEHETINFSTLHRVKHDSKSLKQELLQLVGDLKSDSKKKEAKARKLIIEICKPVIQKFYDIAVKFNVSENVGWPDEYSNRYGSICEVEGLCENGSAIELYYEDSYYGEVHDCYVHMPLSWLDEGEDEIYAMFCKAKKINLLEVDIKEHERIIELRKREINEIEAL